jgi:hypothetical protein
MFASFKFRFFLFHLGLSTLLVAGVAVLVLLVWLPYPFYILDGAMSGLLILAAIDVVLGPLITLILASDKKTTKETALDFSLVFACQIVALVYGLGQFHGQKIVAILHLQNDFHLIRQADVVPGEFENDALEKYKHMMVGMLTDEDFNAEVRANGQSAVPALIASPSHYRPLQLEPLLIKQLDLRFVPALLKSKYGENVMYKTLVGKAGNGIVVLSKSDASVLGVELMKGVSVYRNELKM